MHMFALSDNFIHIILSTSAVYIFILVLLRLLGKTELAQLSVTDLIFVLLISNAVQNAMLGPDTSLAGGLLAASVLFVLNFIFKRLKYQFTWFGKIMEGEPIILFYKGKINEANCKKNSISHNDIMQTLREHGKISLDEVEIIVLEVDGNISVVSKT